MIRAVHAEIVKIRTTGAWWLTGLGIVGCTLLALLINILVAHFDDLAQHGHTAVGARSAAGPAKIAAGLYTSGQFFGVLLTMLLGAIIVTSEYSHRTATGTFLATPRRSTVVIAKVVVAGVLAAAAWLLTSAISVAAGAAFLRSEHVATGLGRWDVGRSILLNLAAYLLWAALGVGLGVLLRSQIGSVAIGTAMYLGGFAATGLVFELVHSYVIRQDWVLSAQVIAPAIASSVMTTPGGTAFEHAPPQWVGAAVLMGYAVVAGTLGTLIVKRRDVSS
jgi:ABC-type transport system involved in multi-copper enzyme maturation permease subunit